MMNRIFAVLILLCVLCGVICGRLDALTNVILSEGMDAIELTLCLMGGMCVWGGMLRVAERAGITAVCARFGYAITKRLFRGIDPNGKALPAITMNLVANLLGLGNAATPFGLEAVRELQKEDHCGDTASDHMVLFTVLNTASLTILPTTVATLRLQHGAAEPLCILPAVALTTCVVLCVVVTACKACALLKRSAP